MQSFGVDADDDESNHIDDDIHDRYSSDMRTFSNYNLPIMSYEREILDAIETNTAIVLQAATGSGKTTQVSYSYTFICYSEPNFGMDFARLGATIYIGRCACEEKVLLDCRSPATAYSCVE